MYNTDNEIERVILIGVQLEDDDTTKSLDELAELARTAGAETVGRIIQPREYAHPSTYIGKGKLDESLTNTEGYVQYEYIKEELSDLFALADLVISRAGANAICEISALKKPNLLIPLSANASRGDQILNARSFERLGYSKVLEEEELTQETLLQAIQTLYQNREDYITAMSQSNQMDSIGRIVDLICQYA